MKLLGLAMMVVGALWALVAFNIDTTVATIGQDRVHNIGKIDQRQSHLLVSGLMIIVGAVFFAFGRLKDSRAGSPIGRNGASDYKRCPFCSDYVSLEAVICKHCGSSLSVSALAEQFGNLPPSEMLQKFGIARVNGVGKDGLTPLMRYAQRGDKEMVFILLQGGADKNESTMSGVTASDKARAAGYPEVAELIDTYTPGVDVE